MARLRESRKGIDNESIFASKRMTGTVDLTSFAATLSRMLPELERAVDDSTGRLVWVTARGMGPGPGSFPKRGKASSSSKCSVASVKDGKWRPGFAKQKASWWS